MNGLLLSLAAFGVLVALSVVAIRFSSVKKYFKPLIGSFLVSTLLYSVMYWFVWPRVSAVEYWNGMLILFLLFHSYWDTIYTSFLTGFSSGMLIRILRYGDRGVTIEDLILKYGCTQKASPVVTARLDNLLSGRYIQKGERGYFLLPKGKFFAVLTKTIQKSLNMGAGG